MELTEQQIGLDRIRPSALDLYEKCPRWFYYKYWLGLELEEDRLHMDFGTAIHEAIHAIFLEYDNNFGGGWEYASFSNVLKQFGTFWKPNHVTDLSLENYVNTVAGRASSIRTKQELYQYFKNDAVAMLRSYWNEKERLLIDYNHDLAEFEVAMKVELRNPLEPNEKLPIPMTMRIDAINRTRTKLVDFKTSGSKYNQAETRQKIQGQCYLFGILMETGVLINDFDYVVIRKGLKSEDRIQVVSLNYDMADMAALYQRIKMILVGISNKEFSPPAIGHSPYCGCYQYERALKVK